MAETSRLAKLPGYDTAPDVYETPELTDDTSITRRTSTRSPSASSTPASSDEENEDEDDSYGLSKRHLSTSAARERFTRSGKGLDVKAGDFGDRLGVRKGYRVRRREGVEEEESLEQRITRLRREVEECRVLAREEGGEGGEDAGDASLLGETEGLKKVLEGLQGGRTARQIRRAEPIAQTTRVNGGDETEEQDGNATERIAEFDSRLAALERSLGLSSVDGTSLEAVNNPVLPSLTLLDQQLNALMTASSITNLEAASTRLAKLREEAERTAFAAAEPSQNGESTGTSTPTSPIASAYSLPDLQKLQDLYTLLPNLQRLSPTVPALLDRLRSLRALHAGAANASAELEELEKSQAEFGTELREWKEGLTRVEDAMKATDEANGRNGKVVQGWVRELEGRVKALGGAR